MSTDDRAGERAFIPGQPRVYGGATPPPPAEPTVIRADGGLRSSCCRAELSITREVSDTVAYWAEELDDEGFTNVAGEPLPKVLHVRYGKVYEGDAGDYKVTCEGCLLEIDIEVEEL